MSPEFLILCCLSAVVAKRGGGGGTSVGRSTGSRYPSSYGLSGNSHQGTNPSNTYSQPKQTHYSDTQSYPRRTQSHGYPESPGLSGNTKKSYNTYSQKTEVHHHYHYSPPQQITYGSVQHPVFHGQPPVYVYEYRNSGSRFDNILTGLALYNLGRMSSDHHSHYYNHQSMDTGYKYRSTPNEMCKFAILYKTSGKYEETKIDCMLMSSFILEAQNEQKTVVTKTVTMVQNVTIGANSTVVTTQNSTVVDALQVKGPSISITPGMTCFMIHMRAGYPRTQREVECGLLQEYATRSLQYNGCAQVLPILSLLLLSITFLL